MLSGGFLSVLRRGGGKDETVQAHEFSVLKQKTQHRPCSQGLSAKQAFWFVESRTQPPFFVATAASWSGTPCVRVGLSTMAAMCLP